MKSFLRNLTLALFICAFSSTTNSVVAQATPTLTSDQADYPPGSTVILTGTGFQAGEMVTLQVLHDTILGDNDESSAHQPWTVLADPNGNFETTWLVPWDQDELGATLK